MPPEDVRHPARPARAGNPGRFQFALATPADDGEIRRLCRDNPMQGQIRVSLEREPDASLAESIEGDVHHTILCRDRRTNRAAAVGSVAVRDAYVNGRVARLGYLSKLRVDAAYRNHVSVLRGGYALLRELHASLGCKLYLTSIFTDNFPARRFLERGLPGMPTYRPVETFETLVMPTTRRAGAAADPDPADHRPQAADVLRRNARRFQFAPCWDCRQLSCPSLCRGLRREDFLVAQHPSGAAGCLAVWDQRAYKQVVVRGYVRKLRRSRPLLNLLAPVLRVPRLPGVGERLDVGYVSHLAVDGDDPHLFADLLRRALAAAAARGLTYLAMGLSSRHPLLPVAKRLYRHRRSTATLYAVHWDDGTGAAAELDGRVAHYEVALL